MSSWFTTPTAGPRCATRSGCPERREACAGRPHSPAAASHRGSISSHKPTKYDYKGSGAITDQVDNVISVWRNKAKEKKRDEDKQVDEKEPDALLICDKQRNGEWEGSIGLWFDRASMQYVGGPGDEPLLMYRHPEDF